MSTVATENLKRATEAVARSLRGVAAAWVNFNGTGTVAIVQSQNVSSITDSGTGDYTETLTSSLSSATSRGSANTSGAFSTNGSIVTASLNDINCAIQSGAAVDSSVCFSAIFGDLA
jgi:hypothetical protein